MITANDIFPPERFGLITGSGCSVLFPKKSADVGQESYAVQLANERFWQYYDNNTTWQTEHGSMNEYHAEQFYTHTFGEFGGRPEFVCDQVNQIGGSADWVGSSHGVDWKCPTTLAGWLQYHHRPDKIIEEYFYQAQMYMHLFGMKRWIIAGYLTETMKMIDNGLVYPVPESQRMILVEIPYQDGFSENLIVRCKPIIKRRDEILESLTNKFKTI